MPNYRPVEETYPFFEATFCIGENGRVGLISSFDVAAYSPLDPPRGTKVFLGSGPIEIYDSLPEFEERLFATMAVAAQGEVEDHTEQSGELDDHPHDKATEKLQVIPNDAKKKK